MAFDEGLPWWSITWPKAAGTSSRFSETEISMSTNHYIFRVKLKDGREGDIPFEVKGDISPYEFVIKILFQWCLEKTLIEEATLFENGKYLESYNPEKGWINRQKGEGTALGFEIPGL